VTLIYVSYQGSAITNFRSKKSFIISLVIPTYNRCETFKGTLLSVFSQTLLSAEAAVKDNSLTNKTGS
jgi:hypothetical protein